MSTPTVPYRSFVGIDIAAETFMVSRLVEGTTKPDRSKQYRQTTEGFSATLRALQDIPHPSTQTLIVLEATSTYWINVALALHEAGYAVSVINPSQARNFAKALLKRAKTDAIDAQTLALLAQALQPKTWNPPPQVYHELHQRLAQRDSLLHLRQQVKNQLHALTAGHVVIESVRDRMESLIQTLTDQIATVEDEIKDAAEYDEGWKASITLLRSIPGIELLTACWLVVATLNFSLCPTPEAMTHYAGLAPMPRESGTSVRGRPTVGHAGNARLRTALYMATLSATRYNPPVKAFYDRLCERGKVKKVARCAAARKLLHIAFAVVTKGVAFDAQYTLDAGYQESIPA